ncbi:MAG: hypothetical protein AB3N15_10085 [Paracoccaceae bacterium]
MRAIILTLLILVAYPFAKSDKAEPKRYVVDPPDQIEVNDLAPAWGPVRFGLHKAKCAASHSDCRPT